MQLDRPSESATPNTQTANLPRLQALRQATVISLLAFSLLILLLALYLISTSVKNDIARSEANVASLQAQILRLQTPAPAVQALQTTLSNTVALANALDAARPAAGRNWPAVIALLSSYNPAAITLTALRQEGSLLTLTGQAVNDSSVVDYLHTLEQAKLFATVVLESIVLVTPTPQPTVTAGVAAPATERVDFVIRLELSAP